MQLDMLPVAKWPFRENLIMTNDDADVPNLTKEDIAEARPAREVKLQSVDPLEQLVEAALQSAGIAYVTDRDGRNPSNLDFRLPNYDIEIEVKRFHSDRIAEQMTRAPNVIALQGEAAVRFFCDHVVGGAKGSTSPLRSPLK